MLAWAKLAELLHQMDKGTYVDASKITLVEYLRSWHEKNVVPHRRPETARIYLSMIEKHIAKAFIANSPLQKVRTSDLEARRAARGAGARAAPAVAAVAAAEATAAPGGAAAGDAAVADLVAAAAAGSARATEARARQARGVSDDGGAHC